MKSSTPLSASLGTSSSTPGAVQFLRISLLALVLLCISFTAAPAQQAASPPARDPQAITLVQNAIAAMGGSGAGQIQDTLTQATTTWLQNPAAPATTTTIKTKGPDKLRVDNGSGSALNSVIHNQGRNLRFAGAAWKQGPSANSFHKRPEHLPVVLLAYELARPDLTADYIGLETIGTQTAHHIRLARVSTMGNDLDAQQTKNSRLDVFIDPQSFLVLKISYLQFSETDWRLGLPMEIYYSDYRSVAGMLIPFNQRAVFNGNPMFNLSLSSVAFNQGLPDSDFEGR